MRLLFVTVGTSAIANEALGTTPLKAAGRLVDNRALRSDTQKYLDAANQDPLHWQDLIGRIKHAHKLFWSKDDDYKWNLDNIRQTSAELASTYMLLKSRAEEQKENFEEMILISSDTEPGKLAARINQEVMTDSWKLPNVQVRTMPGLEKTFVDSFTAVEQFVANVGHQDEAVFNITGGYKGLIPAIAKTCLDRSWPMFYRHEDSDYGVYLLDRERKASWTLSKLGSKA
jgi:putative CRISPR-associated protein (TIGR02619 family)